ncbi:MAG: FAD-dependent monooxygenase [Nitrospira sp.]|nr:FAD-dependent monooxygenase [Nitrospira sp.]
MGTKHTDILINGYGIGGALLAYMLGKAGLSVTVIERGARERAINGADLLKPAGIQVVTELGLYDDVLSAGGRVRHALRVFHDKEVLCDIDYQMSSTTGKFILIPCEWLRSMVAHQVDSLPSVNVLFNSRITDVERDRAGNVGLVQLADGQMMAPTVLVGADGSHSYVRKILGMVVEGYAYPSPMYFTVLPITPSVEALNRLYVDSAQGLAYFYPVGKEATRLVISFPRDEMQTLLQDNTGTTLKARLSSFVSDESADAIDKIVDTKGFKGTPIGRFNLKSYFGSNMVMLGDAIHNIHPITGQGMNLAIEDANELGKQLIEMFSGRATLPEALRAYQLHRHPINESLVSYGHNLATTFHDKMAFAGSFNVALQTSSRDSQLISAYRNTYSQRPAEKTS